MEVFHRLRIFEDTADNGNFPFIASSLRLDIPTSGTKMHFVYAEKDSSYITNSKLFDTSWGQVESSGVNRALRLYLYGGSDTVNAAVPTMLVSTTKTSTTYNTSSSPYNVSSNYYLYFSGATAEYIDTSESSFTLPSGFKKGNMSTERLLMSDMYPEVYGPYVRTYLSHQVTDVNGKRLVGISHQLYHITQSHWIDVSKLVPCSTKEFGAPTYSMAYHVDGNPGEFIKTANALGCSASFNDLQIEGGEVAWVEKRYNALAKDPNGSGVVLRPKLLDTVPEKGYRVFLSCVIDNILSTSTSYNDEWREMYAGIIWEWVNVQIWEGDTYLSTDVLVYNKYGTSKADITFSNISYIINGTSVSEEDALKKATDTIKASMLHMHRLDVYAIIHDTTAVICTTELDSSILFNNKWYNENGYGTSFVKNGSRYEKGQNYSGSPAYVASQYKIYASTETQVKPSISYKVGSATITDEYHYSTCIAIFPNTFIPRSFDGDNAVQWHAYPVAEMRTGLMWDNVDYNPGDLVMSPYVNASGMNIVGVSYDVGNQTITEGGLPRANYDTSEGADAIPAIIWNATDMYVTVQRNDTWYTTEEAAIAAAKKSAGANGKYQIYKNDDTGKYRYTYSRTKNTWGSTTYRHICFELVNAAATSAGGNCWGGIDTDNVASTFINKDDRIIDVTKLHGPDNGRFICYIKFASSADLNLLSGNFFWHWHAPLGTTNNESHTLVANHNGAECTVHFPKEFNGTTDCSDVSTFKPYKPESAEIYTYDIDSNGSFVYTSTKKFRPKIDTWYGIIITKTTNHIRTYSGDVPAKGAYKWVDNVHDMTVLEHTYDDVSGCYQTHFDLCEVTDADGNIKPEHQKYIGDSNAERRCAHGDDDTIVFYASYKDTTYRWSISMTSSDFSKYFTTTKMIDDSIHVSFNNAKRDEFLTAYPDAFITIPAEDGNVCVSVDAKLKNVYNLFNSSKPICIPEYSGCYFVKYTN